MIVGIGREGEGDRDDTSQRKATYQIRYKLKLRISGRVSESESGTQADSEAEDASSTVAGGSKV